jgi:exosortase
LVRRAFLSDRPARALRIVGLALLLALIFSATLRWLIGSWENNPYYGHGWLIPPVALFFAWRAARATPAGGGGSYWGAGLILIGLLIHLLALPIRAFYLSALMLVPVLLGLVLLLGGWPAFRRQFFPLALLGLMVPLPMVPTLSPPLEAFSAGGAANLGRLMGLAVVQDGSQVSLPGQAFVVAAPCSGLYSLVALSTLTVIFLYLADGDPRGRLALLLLVPPIALAANVIRITVLLAVAGNWGTEAALGYYHTYSSIVLFLIGLGSLILASRFLRCGGIRRDIF